MRYVGIDPSTKTGFVILNDDGSVHKELEITSIYKRDPQRFMDIEARLIHELSEYGKVIIEGFSYGSKGKNVSTQYGIGWIIRAMFVRSNIDYVEVPPTTLKKFATGKGTSKKEDMILPIYKKWGYEHDSDNVRDAYILAQIGRYMDGLEEPTKYQEDVLKKLRGALRYEVS